MQNEDALLDGLLAQKTNRSAAGVFSGVDAWFKQTFGTSLPVKNLGASDFERKAGWEHSHAFDVGLNPNSSQGQQLLKYLDSQGIPYSAFSGAVSRGGRTIATGPHIHVGPPSHRIDSTQSTDDTILDQLGASPDDKILDQLAETPAVERPVDKRGAYGQRAADARQLSKANDAAFEKLARDIEWHFGYGVLQALPSLPPEKQQQIIRIAHQYAQADEAKKKTGAVITKSPAWQLHNQQLVGIREGMGNLKRDLDPEAQIREETQAALNPLLKDTSAAIRPIMETLLKGGAGLLDLVSGLVDPTGQDVGRWLKGGTTEIRRAVEQSQERSGRSKPARIAQQVGSGVIEFAPLALVPEAGLESLMTRIGASAAIGGTYTGIQALGRGEKPNDVLKEAAVGGATFGLMGVPLPGRSQLAKALSNLVIVGGGTTLVNRATGASWEDSATQGLVLTLLRAPELISRVKIEDEKGVERPATVRDIKGLLPATRFDVETAASNLPSALTTPARGAGRRFVEELGQSELFAGVAKPVDQAVGRLDLPGEFPPVMTFDEFAQSRGIDLSNPRNLPMKKIDIRLEPLYQAYKEAHARGGGRGVGTVDAPFTSGAVLDYGNFLQGFMGWVQGNGIDPMRMAEHPDILKKAADLYVKTIAPNAEGVKTLAATYGFEPTQIPFPLPGPLGETRPIYSAERSKLDKEYVGKNDPTLREVAVLEPEQQSYRLAELYQQRRNPKLSALERAKIDRQVSYLEHVVRNLPAGPETGVVRLSEETARGNLKTLQDLKASETWKGLSSKQKAAIDAQLKRLEEQGAGSLPEKPATEAPTRGVRWTTREQLEASPEKLRLMEREQAAAQNVPREAPSNAPLHKEAVDAAVDAYFEKRRRSEGGYVNTSEIAAGIRKVKDDVSWKGGRVVEYILHRPVGDDLHITMSIDKRGIARPFIGPLEQFPGFTGADVTGLKQLNLGVDTLLALKRYFMQVHPEITRIKFDRAGSTGGAVGRKVDLRVTPRTSPELPPPAQTPSEPVDLDAVHQELSTRGLQARETTEPIPTFSVVNQQGREIAKFASRDRARALQSLAEYAKRGESQGGFLNVGEVAKALDDLRRRFPELSDEELRLRFYQEHEKRIPKSSAPGQEGSATLDLISGGLLRKLNTVRQTIVTATRTRSVKDVMAYSRDAGDNNAMIFGRQMRRDVEGPLREALGGRPPKEAPDALSFVIESRGDPTALATMRATINASATATPGWKARALKAIDYAEANYAQLQPIARRYSTITDAQVAHENAAGIDTLRREGYVMHAQDIEGPETGLFAGGGGTGESSAFKKVRTHETFADSIAAGVNPRTLNALDLLEARISRGQRLINRRAWVSDLRGVNDTHTGNPIVRDPTIVRRIDGSTYPQPPQGYSLEYNGFEPIAVHNGYEGIYSALTDPSWFSKNAATRGFMTANAAGKSISLMLDTFHLGRLALWQSMIKALGVKSFKAPFPTYRRGLTLLDSTVPEIRRMEANGEIPRKWTADLLENKRKIDLLVERGFNVGGISDALYQDLIHAVPVVGDFNKWLFSQFQRGAMTEVGLLEFERRRAARPAESEADAARFVAKDLNIRFGNLGRQTWFGRSATAKDLARAIFLAPQWNEGLIRSELGAVKQAGQLAVDIAQGRRIYSGVLLRSVGGMAVAQFAANQLINYITRGHPTWENEEEGWGAKVSAFIPDKLGGGPGFFLHPMGLAAETMHLLMKGYERTEDFSQSLNEYLRSRASSAMRPALVFMTRRDYLGRSLKPGTVWGETVNAAIPAPIPGRAIYGAGRQVVTGKHSEQFPGQFQKQLMSSFGVRTEPVPSGEQRIRNLAAAFNRIHGVEKSGEFYESPYQKLTQSLSHGGDREALDELLKVKKKVDILKYYTTRIDHPLTGSAPREREFLKTLNDEQRKQYVASKERRREDLQVVRKLFESK